MPERSPENTLGGQPLRERVCVPFLLGAQNADGGWGYRNGGQSAVELWHLPKVFCNGLEQEQEECSYDKELRDFKRRLILRVLRDCDGSKSEAARRLGIARGYLHRLINQLRIEDIPEESFADSPELNMPVM